MSAKKHPRPSAKAPAPRSAGSASADPLVLFLAAVALGTPLVSFAADSQILAVDLSAGFVAIAAAVAGAWLLARGTIVWPSSRVGYAWAAFLAWTFLGAILSGRFLGAFMGQPGSHLGWAILVATTLLVVAARSASAPVRATLMQWAPVYVLAQAVAVFIELGLGQMPRGSLPNSTYLGEMLLLLLPLSVDPEAADEKQPWRAIALPLVMIAALAASGSRVATVFATVWAIWTFGVSRRFGKMFRRWAVAVVVMVVVAAGLFFARGEILGSTSSSTFGARPAMLHMAVAATKARPIVGWGLEGFSTGGAAVSTRELVASGPVAPVKQGYSGDPHNIVANLVVASGLVGLALFAWFALEMVLVWVRRAKSGRGDAASVWAIAGLFVILLTAPLTSHVLPALALVIGFSMGPAEKGANSDLGRAVGRALTVGAVLVSAILGVNRFSHAPFDEYSPKTTPQVAAACQRAADLWRVDAQLYFLASMNWGFAAQTDSALLSSRYDLAAIQRASALDPTEPFYQLELARTLKYYRESAATVDAAFAETFERYPLFPTAHADYAKYLAEQGRYAEAKKQVAEAKLIADPMVTQTLFEAEQLIDGH